jgi:IPP transferase
VWVRIPPPAQQPASGGPTIEDHIMSAELPRLITIVGTNASGKSMLGADLAELFDGEVVSADSRQVYRELDIDTGKLASYQMRGVPHHLIDIVGLGTTFSLADYQRHAYVAIDNILLRGRTPFLAGGTGLQGDHHRNQHTEEQHHGSMISTLITAPRRGWLRPAGTGGSGHHHSQQKPQLENAAPARLVISNLIQVLARHSVRAAAKSPETTPVTD